MANPTLATANEMSAAILAQTNLTGGYLWKRCPYCTQPMRVSWRGGGQYGNPGWQCEYEECSYLINVGQVYFIN